MHTISKKYGIGLLELILALIVITALVTLAVRYYTTARENSRIATAVEIINAIKIAAYDQVKANPQSNFTNINLTSLVTIGALPDYYSTTAVHPWHSSNCPANGCLNAEPTSNGDFTITLHTIPAHACNELLTKAKADPNLDSSTSSCTNEPVVLFGQYLNLTYLKPET